MKAAPEAEDARWWCCPLRGLVLVLAVLLASLYTVTIAAASVIWLLHAQAGDGTAGTVVEVNSLTDLYPASLLPEAPEAGGLDVVAVILVTVLAAASLGLATTLLLLLGLYRRSSYLLLPWLVWHMLEILGSVASGLYLVIYFLLLLEERNVTHAILSLVPILAGIFLILPWVVVDQLLVSMRAATQLVISVDPASSKITRSLSSLSLMRPASALVTRSRSQSQLDRDTLRSTKSVRSLRSVRSLNLQLQQPRGGGGGGARPGGGARSVRSVKKRNDLRRHNQFHFRPEMLSRKSRSLEHILDSGSSSSRSSADTAAAAVATMTLPRLRRCAEVPGMWRAEYGGNTDTMRSCRSINSIKSVQISNEVTEFHYSDSEAAADRAGAGDGDDGDVTPAAAEPGPGDQLQLHQLPAPVYPTINKRSWNYKLADKKNTFTKDQIIDLYCAAAQSTDR